jgi:hypothetical protein
LMFSRYHGGISFTSHRTAPLPIHRPYSTTTVRVVICRRTTRSITSASHWCLMFSRYHGGISFTSHRTAPPASWCHATLRRRAAACIQQQTTNKQQSRR